MNEYNICTAVLYWLALCRLECDIFVESSQQSFVLVKDLPAGIYSIPHSIRKASCLGTCIFRANFCFLFSWYIQKFNSNSILNQFHLHFMFKSDCNYSATLFDFIAEKTFNSSAKRSVVLKQKLFSMSIVKTLNYRGPKCEPCGTSDKIGISFEKELLLIRMICFRLLE